jgi:hypothetical protein
MRLVPHCGAAQAIRVYVTRNASKPMQTRSRRGQSCRLTHLQLSADDAVRLIPLSAAGSVARVSAADVLLAIADRAAWNEHRWGRDLATHEPPAARCDAN